MVNLDKIHDKIKKLLALAKGAEDIGSIEEAANAAAQVQKLLLKYNLELSEIDLEERKHSIENDMYNLKDIHGWNKNQGNWLTLIYFRVSTYNFCKTIGIGTPGKYCDPRVQIFGEKHNIEIVLDLCLSLISQIKALEGKRWKELQGQITDKRATFRRSYFQGCVDGINQRLYEEREANKKEWTGTTGLVVQNDKALDLAIKEKYGDNLKSSTRRQSKSMAGYSNGVKDGKAMGTKRGVQGTTNNHKQIGI
jgi:hypothetical protein